MIKTRRVFLFLLSIFIFAGSLLLPVYADEQTVHIYVQEGESVSLTNSSGAYTDYTGITPDENIASAALEAVSEQVEIKHSASDTGSLEGLDSCLFTFRHVEGDTYEVFSTVDGETVYLGPGTAPNGSPYFPTSVISKNITVKTDYSEDGTFHLLDDSAEPRYLHFNSERGHFDRVLEESLAGSESFIRDCQMELYVKDAKTTDGEIPGYRKITSKDEIEDGEQYLVVAKARDGQRYAVAPSTDTENNTDSPFSYTAKVLSESTNVTVTGNRVGDTSFTLGETTY